MIFIDCELFQFLLNNFHINENNDHVHNNTTTNNNESSLSPIDHNYLDCLSTPIRLFATIVGQIQLLIWTKLDHPELDHSVQMTINLFQPYLMTRFGENIKSQFELSIFNVQVIRNDNNNNNNKWFLLFVYLFIGLFCMERE